MWRARDLVCVFDDPRTVMELKPELDKVKALKGALMQVTAPGTGTEYDCVSRTFTPKMGLPEDPVCGSGHCHIIPYWAERLGKRMLTARQASPRGGTLYCRLEGTRVLLAGRAALFSISGPDTGRRRTMRKKRWTAAVAAVLCVLTLAGCKGKPLPDGMEEDAVLAAGEEIVQQLTDGDYSAVLAQFRSDIREGLTAEQLQTQVETATQKAGQYPQAG